MSDRELLTLAAKAAGLTIGLVSDCDLYWSHSDKCFKRHGTDVGYEWPEPQDWNPLEDDGDALRLAVRLRLDLTFGRAGLVFVQDASNLKAEGALEGGDDSLAATRRAIVRAAAEIGRAR